VGTLRRRFRSGGHLPPEWTLCRSKPAPAGAVL
jgi:hypothetical protein